MRNTSSTKTIEKAHVHSPQKGDVRNAEGNTDVLQKSIKRAEGIWFCDKPIRPMSCKEVDKRRTTHCGMARRRHGSVTQK